MLLVKFIFVNRWGLAEFHIVSQDKVFFPKKMLNVFFFINYTITVFENLVWQCWKCLSWGFNSGVYCCRMQPGFFLSYEPNLLQ